jgi:hypothetical protein
MKLGPEHARQFHARRVAQAQQSAHGGWRKHQLVPRIHLLLPRAPAISPEIKDYINFPTRNTMEVFRPL